MLQKKIPPNKTKYIKVGFYNDYPCLMVHFKPDSPVFSSKKPSAKAFEAWVDYMSGRVFYDKKDLVSWLKKKRILS